MFFAHAKTSLNLQSALLGGCIPLSHSLSSNPRSAKATQPPQRTSAYCNNYGDLIITNINGKNTVHKIHYYNYIISRKDINKSYFQVYQPDTSKVYQNSELYHLTIFPMWQCDVMDFCLRLHTDHAQDHSWVGASHQNKNMGCVPTAIFQIKISRKWVALPKTNSLPLKIGRALKGKYPSLSVGVFWAAPIQSFGLFWLGRQFPWLTEFFLDSLTLTLQYPHKAFIKPSKPL